MIDHTPEWHEARRAGVGGSDIPILAGLSPYDRGVHDLYLEKTGALEPQPANPAMEVGAVLEDAIAILYSRRTGKAVIRANKPVRHPDYPWAIGNLDRKVRGERRLVEIKNRRWLPRGDGLPPDVECQVQWYLGVTRYPVGDVALLVGGQDLRLVEVRADEGYFRDLLTIAGEFWARVQDGRPPDIDGSAAAVRYLATRYPWHRGEDLAPPTPEIDALAADLRAAKTESREALGRVASIENAIKALLGETPGVQGADYRITWKRVAGYERTNWASVVEDYLASHETAAHEIEPLAARYTTTVEGGRRFVATFEGEAAA